MPTQLLADEHPDKPPEVLLVDILLPGIDGATLITSLRSHAQFKHSRLIVITSLDASQRAALAALGPGPYTIDGEPPLRRRARPRLPRSTTIRSRIKPPA